MDEKRDNVEHCPHCDANLQGKEIPKESQHMYGATHFSRMIGIDGGRMGIYDGVVAWLCPDCDETYPRGDSTWAKEMYDKYKNIGKEKK
jgi:hypothetical protein